jgi:hypothetical protein
VVLLPLELRNLINVTIPPAGFEPAISCVKGRPHSRRRAAGLPQRPGFRAPGRAPAMARSSRIRADSTRSRALVPNDRRRVRLSRVAPRLSFALGSATSRTIRRMLRLPRAIVRARSRFHVSWAVVGAPGAACRTAAGEKAWSSLSLARPPTTSPLLTEMRTGGWKRVPLDIERRIRQSCAAASLSRAAKGRTRSRLSRPLATEAGPPSGPTAPRGVGAAARSRPARAPVPREPQQRRS